MQLWSILALAGQLCQCHTRVKTLRSSPSLSTHKGNICLSRPIYSPQSLLPVHKCRYQPDSWSLLCLIIHVDINQILEAFYACPYMYISSIHVYINQSLEAFYACPYMYISSIHVDISQILEAFYAWPFMYISARFMKPFMPDRSCIYQPDS